MVSSGAVAEGMKRLGWRTRPTELHELQAAAAVGQMGLAQMYETQLSRFGMGSAQVLLTHADLRRTAKVRAFINFMANAIMPHKDLIEGRRPPGFSSGDRLAVESSYAAATTNVSEDISA